MTSRDPIRLPVTGTCERASQYGETYTERPATLPRASIRTVGLNALKLIQTSRGDMHITYHDKTTEQPSWPACRYSVGREMSALTVYLTEPNV